MSCVLICTILFFFLCLSFGPTVCMFPYTLFIFSCVVTMKHTHTNTMRWISAENVRHRCLNVSYKRNNNIEKKSFLSSVSQRSVVLGKLFSTPYYSYTWLYRPKPFDQKDVNHSSNKWSNEFTEKKKNGWIRDFGGCFAFSQLNNDKLTNSGRSIEGI